MRRPNSAFWNNFTLSLKINNNNNKKHLSFPPVAHWASCCKLRLVLSSRPPKKQQKQNKTKNKNIATTSVFFSIFFFHSISCVFVCSGGIISELPAERLLLSARTLHQRGDNVDSPFCEHHHPPHFPSAQMSILVNWLGRSPPSPVLPPPSSSSFRRGHAASAPGADGQPPCPRHAGDGVQAPRVMRTIRCIATTSSPHLPVSAASEPIYSQLIRFIAIR